MPADDEDSGDDMAERIRSIARRIAQDELDGEVESAESEVDSDEAFEESDEERWGETFERLDRGKGKKGKSKAKEVVHKVGSMAGVFQQIADALKPAKPLRLNLDEDEDLTDLPNALEGAEESEEEDGDEEDDPDDSDEEDEDAELSSAEEDEEDDDPELPSDMSEEEDADLNDLDAFVDSLAAADASKKAIAAPHPEDRKKIRKALPLVSGPRLDDADTAALQSGALHCRMCDRLLMSLQVDHWTSRTSSLLIPSCHLPRHCFLPKPTRRPPHRPLCSAPARLPRHSPQPCKNGWIGRRRMRRRETRCRSGARP